MKLTTHITSPRMIADGQGAWAGSLAELIDDTERYAEQRAADLMTAMIADDRIEPTPEGADEERTLTDVAEHITLADVRFLTDDPNARTAAPPDPTLVIRARQLFARRGGDPELAGELVEWARGGHAEGALGDGVLVREDGTVECETTWTPKYAPDGTPRPTYLVSEADRERLGHHSRAVRDLITDGALVHITRDDVRNAWIDWERVLTRVTSRRRSTTDARETADAEWRALIRAASGAGLSYARIAGLADVSRSRVQQIIERRR